MERALVFFGGKRGRVNFGEGFCSRVQRQRCEFSSVRPEPDRTGPSAVFSRVFGFGSGPGPEEGDKIKTYRYIFHESRL